MAEISTLGGQFGAPRSRITRSVESTANDAGSATMPVIRPDVLPVGCWVLVSAEDPAGAAISQNPVAVSAAIAVRLRMRTSVIPACIAGIGRSPAFVAAFSDGGHSPFRPPTVLDVSQYIRALTKGRWRSGRSQPLNEADGAELVGIDPESLERLCARLPLRGHRGGNRPGRTERGSQRPQVAAGQDKAR